MKKSSKLASSLVASALLLSLTTGAGAFASPSNDGVNQLVTTPPVSEFNVITPFGADKPSSGASVHNLSVSEYNYQVQKIGYRVYTDKWLKGATSLKVSVNNWKIIKDWGGESNELAISLYSENGFVDSKTINPSQTFSASFSGLTSTKKYYVMFQVPTNNNTYSFNGTISKSK
jgi:hypothetical protein